MGLKPPVAAAKSWSRHFKPPGVPCAIASVACRQLTVGVELIVVATNFTLTVGCGSVSAFCIQRLWRMHNAAIDGMPEGTDLKKSFAAAAPAPAGAGYSPPPPEAAP